MALTICRFRVFAYLSKLVGLDDEQRVEYATNMHQELWGIVLLGVYFVFFFMVVMGIGLWLSKRGAEKPPLEFKLLRGPGESLRRRLNKFDEDFFFQIGGAAMVPVVAGLLTFCALLWLTPHLRINLGLAIVAFVMLPFFFLAGRWTLAKLMRARNDRLGYLGERSVGEALLPLVAAGFRVFHDIPAESNNAKFNVDHVAVGPTGIFAIETKTRRKGRARAGYEAHKVAFDGRQLIWPWAEDRYGLKNAEDRARWLTEKLNKLTGIGVAASPVLVLPGWYVVPKGIGPVMVVNHKQLAGAIMRGKQAVLTEAQVDLIARQLDQLCRDVED